MARKIIAGNLGNFLTQLKKYDEGFIYLDEALKENKIDHVKTIMDKYLTRNSDRVLFDLELLTETE